MGSLVAVYHGTDMIFFFFFFFSNNAFRSSLFGSLSI